MIVVFDFDGTVADTMDSLAREGTAIIRRFYGVSQQDAYEMYMSTVGLPFTRQLDVLFSNRWRNEVANRIFLRRHKNIYQAARLFQTVPDALDLASVRGWDVAVCSSSPEQLVKDVLARELDFTGLVLGQERGTKTQVLEALKEQAVRVIFIGDAPYDGAAAWLARVEFMGVEHTFTCHQFQANKLPSAGDLITAVDLATR